MLFWTALVFNIKKFGNFHEPPLFLNTYWSIRASNLKHSFPKRIYPLPTINFTVLLTDQTF